jgi:hypothetical protein
MKLSEAMRKGSELRPQGFGSMFTFSPRVPEEFDCVASCALGAAYEAVHREYKLAPQNSALLYADFPVLATPCEAPCECSDVKFLGSDVRDCIVHLNDSHMTTREEIADWVEQFEIATHGA